MAADRPGRYELQVRVGEERFTKTAVFSDAVLRRSPRRPSRGFFDQLLYPAELPLPADAPIESILVDYPDGQVSLRTEWAIAQALEALEHAAPLATVNAAALDVFLRMGDLANLTGEPKSWLDGLVSQKNKATEPEQNQAGERNMRR